MATKTMSTKTVTKKPVSSMTRMKVTIDGKEIFETQMPTSTMRQKIAGVGVLPIDWSPGKHKIMIDLDIMGPTGPVAAKAMTPATGKKG
jgi:hypothetical protein